MNKNPYGGLRSPLLLYGECMIDVVIFLVDDYIKDIPSKTKSCRDSKGTERTEGDMGITDDVRTIEFYKVVLDLAFVGQAKSKDIYSVFSKVFAIDHVRASTDVIIDKLIMSENGFLGSVGRNTDFTNQPLAQVRNLDLSVEQAKDVSLEFYTYFYVSFVTHDDLGDFIIAVLVNEKAPRLPTHLRNVLKQGEHQLINSCDIQPFANSTLIKNKIGRVKEIGSISFKTTILPSSAGAYYLQTLDSVFDEVKDSGDCLSVSLGLKNFKPSPEMLEKLMSIEAPGLSSLKIEGVTDDEVSGVIDVITSIFRMKIRIPISDEDLRENYLKVKDHLSDAIKSTFP